MNLNTEIKQEKEIHPLGHPTRPFTNRPCPPICTHFFPFTVPKIITCSLKAPRTAVRLQHCAGTEMKQEDGGGEGGESENGNRMAQRGGFHFFTLLSAFISYHHPRSCSVCVSDLCTCAGVIPPCSVSLLPPLAVSPFFISAP